MPLPAPGTKRRVLETSTLYRYFSRIEWKVGRLRTNAKTDGLQNLSTSEPRFRVRSFGIHPMNRSQSDETSVDVHRPKPNPNANRGHVRGSRGRFFYLILFDFWS